MWRITNFIRSAINYLLSGPVVALELLGENGIARWQEACLMATSSLRVCCGKDEIHNAVYGSQNAEIATQVWI